jgi:hypothetical protein
MTNSQVDQHSGCKAVGSDLVSNTQITLTAQQEAPWQRTCLIGPDGADTNYIDVVADEGQQWVEVEEVAVDPQDADEDQEQGEGDYVLRGGTKDNDEWQEVGRDVGSEVSVTRLDILNHGSEWTAASGDADKEEECSRRQGCKPKRNPEQDARAVIRAHGEDQQGGRV